MPIQSTTNPFAQVPQTLVDRSQFDCSFTHKTSLDGGYLVPVFRDEVGPGDTISLTPTLFARLATQITPFMDNAYVEFHLWSVPRRLVWDHFNQFMGEKKNPGDSTDYLIPQVQAPSSGFEPQSLYNYLGVPAGVPNVKVDACYGRACNLIYNEWYRDENLQDSLPLNKGDGPDNPDDYKLFKRGKRGDYFTTCLPQPQKGPSVVLSLGQSAPVYSGNGTNNPSYINHYNENPGFLQFAYTPNHTTFSFPTTSCGVVAAASNGCARPGAVASSSEGAYAPVGLYADLTQALGPTVNSFRQAIAMQQFLEKDMRGGTRYTELIFSHFGVVSPDARLQRPEFLGSFVANLNQTTVAQTSQTTQGENGSPLANLSAYSVFSASSNSIQKSFTEHCILIGFVNIRCDLTYQYGIDRMLLRRTRYDFPWPAFAHLGEQEVKMIEIYATGTDSDNDIFGYNERYAECRYRNSLVTGKLASNVPGNLHVWHLAQQWDNAPRLNAEFIEENPPFDRVISVQNEPQFLLDCDFAYYKATCLPVYGVPGLTRL